MTNNKSYYAIIPANVRYDKKLTANAKLLYGEITALCNEKGFCWAGDKYFADLYGVSKSSIQNWLKSLYDSGYITRDIVYKDGTREILHRYIKLFVQPTQENLNTSIQKNLRDNNTLINTTVNNTNNNVSTRKKRVYADDDPNKKLAILLLKSVRKNQNIKAPDLDKWANTIRLVIEADKRSGKEVQEMIIWAAQHDFWSGVVLSPSSLRKNWDKIAAQKIKKANSDNWQLPDYSIDPKDEDSESDIQQWPDYRIDDSEREPISNREYTMNSDDFPY
jgi:DNA-binding transcriptional ArsR family regulator